MNLLKNNGWKCLWRGHPAQPTDQLKPPQGGTAPQRGGDFKGGQGTFIGRCVLLPPPPRVQEPPCARTAPWFRGGIFHITFFCQGNGFFMVLVDVGQLFRCAGQHLMCVATGPPGTLSVSHSHTYPLNPSPLLSTPSPKQPAPDKETNNSQLSRVEH